jgi:hypothetical protein
MIEVKGREIVIPREEFNIGTTYDARSEMRHFHMRRVRQGGIDLAGLVFNLDLEYANGKTDTATLTKDVTDRDIDLMLTIEPTMLQVPGTVIIQIRALAEDGTVKWSSYKGAFFVEDCINTPGQYEGKITQLEQYEAEWGSVRDNVRALNSRMDEIVKMADGIDASDVEKEVTDVRVGADGKKYESAGSAVREQITAEKNKRTAADTSLNSAIATERARIDNLTKLGEGSTTGDAELQDIRIGADGKTYETAGNAVREQVGALKEDLDILNEGGLNLKEDFIGKQVNNWLDKHPEATTTVQNHSLTVDKMVIGTLGYVTPEMFGAVGDGETDDTEAIQNMFNVCDVAYFCGSKTYVCNGITIKDSVKNILFNGCTFIKSKKGTLFSYKNVNNIEISNFSVIRKGEGIGGIILSVYGKNYKICNVEVIKSEDIETPTNGWCFKLEGDNIIVENCIIHNNYGETYDGIHFGCCSNVIIRNCNIFSGDDCIAFYPQPSSKVDFHYHRNELSKNLLIENCNLQCTNPYSAIKLGTSDNISNYGVELTVKDCIINTKIVIGNPGFTNPINNNVVKMIGCKCTGDGTSTFGLFQTNKDFGKLTLQDCEIYSENSVNRVINSEGNNIFLIDNCNIKCLKKGLGYFINDSVTIKGSKLITYDSVTFKACNFYIFNSEFERINRTEFGFSISEINEKEMVVIGSRIMSILQGQSSTAGTANLLISKDNIGNNRTITEFNAINKYYELGNMTRVLTAKTLRGTSAETTDMLKISVDNVNYWIPVLQV